jgi:hypothetical protein
MQTRAEAIVEQLSGERGGRDELNRLWEEVAQVLSPERQGFTGHLEKTDARRTDHIFDTVPITAKRGLTNAISSLLRPKSSAPGKWFDIMPENEKLLDDSAVKDWIEKAEEKLWRSLYNPDARFIEATGEVDDDMVTFGTGAGWLGLRQDRNGLSFRSFHMANTYILVNADNVPDGVLVIEWLTAKQAAGRWGEDKLHKLVRDCLTAQDASSKNKKWEFCWSVQERFIRDPSIKNNRNMPYESVVVDVKNVHVVLEEGFEEFPFFLPRWDTRSGEKYGRGVGVLALPDVLTLNQMGKTMLRSLHRAVDPTMLLPSGSMVTAPQMHPGGTAYYDAKAVRNLGLSNPFIEIGARTAQIPWGLDAQTRRQEQIFALFFRNVLNLPTNGPDMTATEVIQRREEFVREIGAVFGRLESDYTGPIVERAFNIMLRKGAFGAPGEIPEELQGANLEFRFASPVEKAKRQIEEATVTQTMEKVLQVAQFKPEVADPFDWTEYGKFLGTSNDFPQSLMLSADKIEQNAQQRNQQVQQAQGMEQAQQMAQVAKDVPEDMRQNLAAAAAGGEA